MTPKWDSKWIVITSEDFCARERNRNLPRSRKQLISGSEGTMESSHGFRIERWCPCADYTRLLTWWESELFLPKNHRQLFVKIPLKPGMLPIRQDTREITLLRQTIVMQVYVPEGMGKFTTDPSVLFSALRNQKGTQFVSWLFYIARSVPSSLMATYELP